MKLETRANGGGGVRLAIRRAVLAIGAILAAGTALADAEPPALAPKVQAGALPPLAERLPKAPKVVEPFKEDGGYGGTLRLTMRGPQDTTTLTRSIGYENLTRYVNWQPDNPGSDIVPDVEMNIAESVDVNPEATEYVFHLREGMRWSDGEPFTADDIMFWYEHVYSNKELFPVSPRWSVAGGKPLKVEKIDAATVAFRFAAPNGLLLTWLATPSNDPNNNNPNVPTIYPAHYLKEFHPAFNPNADAEARAAGAQSWVDRFFNLADAYRNPAVPTLHAWVVTQGIGQGRGEQVVAERNPYYFKVDPEGRQLPYIDRVTVDVVADQEVTLLRAANGAYDMVDSYIGYVTTPENRGTFYDNQERGGYRFYEVLPNRANLHILSLNLNTPDETKRALFRDREFRKAMSHAINREEIIELVYLGQGRPYQVVERPESPLFDEEMATQHTEFDLALANRMLDGIGLTERNGAGTRLLPDGRPLQITIDIAVVRRPWLDATELIRGYWREVGVDLVINTMEVTALQERAYAGRHEATVWSASGGADTLFIPRYYFPFDQQSYFAPLWGQWYAGVAGMEEPPPAARRQMKLYDELFATPDQVRRIAIFKEIFAIAKEEYWAMGLIQPTTDYGIINARLRNVPDILMASTMYTHPGASNPEQYFFAAE